MDSRQIALLVAGGAGLYVAYKYFVVPDVSEYQLLNPLIEPKVSTLGSNVNITLHIKNNSTQSSDVIVRAEVHEVNDEVGSVGSTYISPIHNIKGAETWSPSFTWIATGKAGGKWIVVWLYKGDGKTLTTHTGPNNPNFFKQTFDVVEPTIGDVTQKVSVIYSTPVVGERLKATITIRNTSTTPVSPLFRLDIRKDEGFFSSWQGDDAPFSTIGSIAAGQTTTFVLLCGINTPTDWAGINTMCAQVVLLGVDGAWDYKNGLVVAGGGATVTFAVTLTGYTYLGSVEQWLAWYYDTASQQWIESSWREPYVSSLFQNVNPGGYLAVVLVVDGIMTGWITSTSFNATNGDSWYFNVYLHGQSGDMYKA